MLPKMNVGGAEKHVILLASGLRQRGYDAQILSIFQEGTLAGKIRKEEIPFSCLQLPKGWGGDAFFKIYQWLRQNPVDILHTYLFGFHLFAGLPARLLKVPVIVSSRREIAEWRKARHVWIENLGNHFVDRVICCSQAAQKWTLDHEKIAREKVLTLYNGVDQKYFASADGLKIRHEFGIPENAFVVGTVANFAEEKGYPYLLEAVSVIAQEHPEAWFLFVGSGPLEAEIKQKAARLPNSDRILFTGIRSDIPDLISAMNVFVLASVIEGFPNVLLEAMSMAKPVVATCVGGIPELIESEKDGILVFSKDSQGLANVILQCLRDPSTANRLGTKARHKIEQNFSLDQMIDQYEAFYRKMLDHEIATSPAGTRDDRMS